MSCSEKSKRRIVNNDQNDYDVLIFKAGNSLQKLEFIDAEHYYIEASEIAKKHPLCKLNTNVAHDNYVKFQPPINYQKLLVEADYFFMKKDYKQCIKEYTGC